MTTDVHALAAAYALDALDADERAEFEAHLDGCDSCRKEIEGFTAVTTGLAGAAAATPPTHLRTDVLGKLDDIEQDRPSDAPVVSLDERRRRSRSVPSFLTAAAVVALIAIGAVVLFANRAGSDFDDVVAAADAVVIELDGETGSVEVVYSDLLDRVALRGENVDDLDSGLRYALWAIADGTPIAAGQFEADDGTIRDVAVVDVDAQAWGITVESDSDADEPTGEIIYFAEV